MLKSQLEPHLPSPSESARKIMVFGNCDVKILAGNRRFWKHVSFYQTGFLGVLSFFGPTAICEDLTSSASKKLLAGAPLIEKARQTNSAFRFRPTEN